MLYTCNLDRVVRKVIDEGAYGSTIDKIIQLLPLDPEVTNMEALLLCGKDVTMMTKKKLQEAIDNAHPNVIIIYIATSSNELEKLTCKNKMLVKKYEAEYIEQVLSRFLKNREFRAIAQEINSADKRISEETPTEEIPVVVEEPVDEEVAVTETIIPEEETEEEIEEVYNTTPEVKALREVNYEALRKEIDLSTIQKRLLAENHKYQSNSEMIKVLNQNIINVFKNPTLTSSEKFQRIQDIAAELSIYKGVENFETAKQLIDSFEKIVLCAKNAAEEEIANAKIALDATKKRAHELESDDEVNLILQKRTNTQYRILTLISEIRALAHTMTEVTDAEVLKLTDNKIVDNERIETLLSPVKERLTPENTSELINEIILSIKEGTLSLSAVEEKLQNVIREIYALCELDNDLIELQQNLSRIVQLNRLEDSVVINSVIKNILRVFIVTGNDTEYASAYIRSKVQARSHNTLLLDLTGSKMYEMFGLTPITYEKFQSERVNEHFCFVKSNGSAEDLRETITQLKKRIDYYGNINIVIDADQTDLIAQLVVDAITINYITDCSIKSMRKIALAKMEDDYENISRRLTMINPPISLHKIISHCGLDVMQISSSVIPEDRLIKACALEGRDPAVTTMMDIFEEAYR